MISRVAEIDNMRVDSDFGVISRKLNVSGLPIKICVIEVITLNLLALITVLIILCCPKCFKQP